MEWRRVYPKLLLKLLGSATVLGILILIAGALIFPPIIPIGLMFFAGSLGIWIAVGIEIFFKSNKTYKAKLYLDTNDIIELISTCIERGGKIYTHKLKERKIHVGFEYFDWFTYYPYRGYIEIPEFSMRSKQYQMLADRKPQTIIEDLIGRKMKTRGMLKERKDLDLDRMEKEIKKIKAIEVQKQMGNDRTPYTDSPVDRYLNYTIFISAFLGLVAGPSLVWLISRDVFATVLYGGLLGPLSGFMLWAFIMIGITLKFGNISMPYKFRLMDEVMDIADKKMTKRWSVPYVQMKKVRRINGTWILLIDIHDPNKIKGGMETLFMDKLMIKMDEKQIDELDERLKKSKKVRTKTHRYTSLSDPDVIGVDWKKGERKKDEFFEVGDDDVEDIKEKVVYYIKP